MVGRALCSAAASSAAKVVVVGGSGFVGSALCKAAVARGADVFSVSRGGKPGAKQLADSSWAREVTWLKGDALNASDWPEEYLDGVAGVISCVGSFGGHDFMRKVCGEANVRVFDEAKRRGVARAVFISAHDYGPPLRDLLKGYFDGKLMAEEALFRNFSGGTGTSVRPGMVHGTRYVAGSLPVPLSAVGKPLELVLGNQVVRAAVEGTIVPGALQRLLVPAVSADAVAQASVDALMGPIPAEFEDDAGNHRRVLGVWDILSHRDR